jgi:pimeloyl-ACP methyl ester carboxylesterase
MHQPLHDFGGFSAKRTRQEARPATHLAVANGFPPATYSAFVRPLLAGHRVVSLPPRALWPEVGSPPAQAGTWDQMADDLLAGWRALGIDRLVAVGHSYGGVASLLAAVREPERFEALVLLDPTIFPRQVMAEIAELRRDGRPARFELVEGARKRRSRFASVDEAFAFWRERSLFRLWPDETLRWYAESMTRAAADGDGVELTWTGEWEAWYYESFQVNTWEHAARLSPDIPLLVLAGGTSNTVRPEAVAEMREVWPHATIEVIPGHGHLFPQEMGEAAGRVVADWLGVVGER